MRVSGLERDRERILANLEKLAGNGHRGEIEKLGDTVYSFSVSATSSIATLVEQIANEHRRVNILQSQIWGLILLIVGAAAVVLRWG